MTTSADLALGRIVDRAVEAAGAVVQAGDVDRTARRMMVRSIAGAIAGGADPVIETLARAAGPGSHPVLTGRPPVSTAAAAAGIHAAAVTVAQCDDGLREAAGHPGLHAFGAAWSVGRQTDARWGDILAAYVAGWEVGAALGLMLGRPRRGTHPHGGWGAAAAAVAAAHLLGGGRRELEAAARAALSVALAGPDSTLTTGSSAHYLLPALGTANGVTVGQLGLDLTDTPADAVSHFAAVAHRNQPDPSAIGDGPLILRGYVKPIGLCAHTLTAWQIADMLRAEGLAAPIVSVRVEAYDAAAALADRSGRTVLARRFSVPWAFAYGLGGRRPGVDDEALRSTVDTVSVVHDPDLDRGYPAGRPVRVHCTLADGGTVFREASIHAGDRESPLTDDAERKVCDGLLDEGRRPEMRTVLDDLMRAPADVRVSDLPAGASPIAITDLEGNR